MEPETSTIQAPLAADPPLDLFNSKYSVATLYKWTKVDILKFFAELKVKEGQEKYGVREWARATMPGVVDAIDKTLKGSQGIFLDPHVNVVFLKSTTTVYTVYDLVGWIFSVTGPTPPKPGRDSYFLPLICVYCVFCRRLNEDIPVALTEFEELAAKKMPYDATSNQITWFEKDRATYTCLGANLDTVDKKVRKKLAEKQKEVQQHRLQQLRASEVIPKGQTKDNVKKNPNTAQLFGHCAETIPFLFVKENAPVQDPKGFAIKGPSIVPDEPAATSKYEPEKFKTGEGGDFLPPCENCSYLLKDGLKFNVEHFKFENLK